MLFLLVSMILIACNINQKSDIVSLEGEWKFVIDSLDKGIQEQWFNKKFTEIIKLPGSMAENMKGYDISVNTKWTGQINNKSWFTDSIYEKYRRPGNIKIPFWLTPVKHQVGPVWYQKEIISLNLMLSTQ